MPGGVYGLPTGNTGTIPEGDGTETSSSPALTAPADGIIVSFKSTAPTNQIRTALQASGLVAPLATPVGVVGPSPALLPPTPAPGSVDVLGQGMSKAALATTLATLRASSAVAYAEPNYLLYAADSSSDDGSGDPLPSCPPDVHNWGSFYPYTPTEPLYCDQWGMRAIQATDGWVWAQLAPDGLAPVPVKMAVVDTGVDAAHPDLQGRIDTADATNVIQGADPTAWDDDSADGHGTAVAGVAVAVYNNGVGIAGVAGGFPVSVMPVKALDSAGVGTLYDVSQGIRYAADHGAKVVNLSLGARLPDYPKTLADAVVYAQNKGVLVVAAAGNDALTYNGDAKFYPADLPGVVAPGALREDDTLAGFSNLGSYNLLAPGVDIETTLPTSVSGTGYGSLTGTSFAAPFVSAMAAVTWSVDPDLSADNVRTLMIYNTQGSKFDFYSEMYRLSTDGVTPRYGLDFVFPSFDGGHLSGTANVKLHSDDPADVDHIDLELQTTVSYAVYSIGSISGTGVSNYTYAWDTTAWPDGQYYLQATSYDVNGVYLASDSHRVVIDNNTETGYSFRVLDPAGKAAAGAYLAMYAITDTPRQPGDSPIWSGNADLQGDVTIPSSVLLDEADYLVVARGADPAFVYFATVRGPQLGDVLDDSNAQTVTIVGNRTDGQPLSGADVSLGIEDGNIPLAGDPDRVSVQVPLGRLAADGTTQVTLTHGDYRFSVADPSQGYLLVKPNVDVASGTTSIDFAPQPADVATLSAALGSGLQLQDMQVWPGGPDAAGKNPFTFEPTTGVSAVTVYPGNYTAVVDTVYAGGDDDWTWGVQTPEFTVDAGDAHHLAVGPPLTAAMSMDPPATTSFQPGDAVGFLFSIMDAYGNKTVALANDVGTTSKPLVTLRDDAGNTVATYSFNLQETYDWVPSTPGDYTATMTVDTGPIAGTLTSDAIAFTVAAAASAANQQVVHVVTASGTPATDAQVDLMELYDDGYSEAVDAESNPVQGYTNSQGDATLEVDDSDAVYVLAVLAAHGSADGSEPVFVTIPYVPQSPLQTVTVDLSGTTGDIALSRVTLTAEDETGSMLGNEYHPPSMYVADYDSEGRVVGEWLGSPYNPVLPNGGGLWVGNGDHTFAAEYGDDTAYGDAGYFEVSPKMAISAPTAVTLGGSGALVPLTIRPAAGRADLGVVGANLAMPSLGIYAGLGYGEYAFSGTSDCDPLLLLVSPGSYDLDIGLQRLHYDGTWLYDLGGTAIVGAGGAAATVDDRFAASIQPANGTAFARGDTVTFNQQVTDSYGHELFAVDTDPNDIEGGCAALESLGAKAQAVGAADAERLRSQALENIVPILTILDPHGQEISRSREASYDDAYFSSSYQIPGDAAPGTYTAQLALGAGPETVQDITASTTFSVAAGPSLNIPVSPTNAGSVLLTGSAQANATITVRYTLNGGVAQTAGTTTAGADGSFSYTLALASEGTYAITASGPAGTSPAVTLVVDRTAPAAPTNLSGTLNSAHTQETLTWTAPTAADLAGFVVKRDGVVLTSSLPPSSTSFVDAGVMAGQTYTYDVQAVDGAGNASAPASLTVDTTLATDTQAPTAPAGLTAVASPYAATLDWQAASDNVKVTGYDILRAGGADAAPTVVGSVYGGSNVHWVDTGLWADTDYTYTVEAFDEAGNVSVPSAPAHIHTPAIAVGTPYWKAPTHYGEGTLLNQHGDVYVSVPGDSGMQAVAEVVYQSWCGAQGDDCTFDANGTAIGTDLAAPVPVTADIPLSEEWAGDYAGSFPIAQGTAELTSLTLVLSDGHGHRSDVPVPGLPLAVAGAMSVEVQGHPGTLAYAPMRVTSAASNGGGYAMVNGPGTYAIGGLPAADDYELQVFNMPQYNSNVTRIADKTGIMVRAGLTTPVSVKPKVPASIKVGVFSENAEGQDVPVPNTIVHLSAPGHLPQMFRTGTDGFLAQKDGTPILVPAWSGEDWTFDAEPTSAPYLGASTTRTLDYALNTVKIEVDPLGSGHVQGKVLVDGKPVANADVVLTDTVRPSLKESFDAHTNSDGTFDAVVYAPGTVSAIFQAPGAHRQTINAGVSTQLAEGGTLVLPTVDLKSAATVTVNVYTKFIGDTEEHPFQLNWSAAAHFRAHAWNITSGGGAGYYDWTGVDSQVLVPGQPGDKIRVVVDGGAAGLDSGEDTVTLDDNRQATAEIHLVQLGHVKAQVRNLQGDVPVVDTWIQLWQTGPDGNPTRTPFQSRFWNGAALLTNVPAGTYQARIFRSTTAVWEGSVQPYGDIKTIDVQVKDATVTDLGTVVLGPLPTRVSDPLNNLRANTNLAAPGSVVTIKGGYHLPANEETGLLGPKFLELLLPNQTTYIAGSLQAAAAVGGVDTAGTTQVDDALHVPLTPATDGSAQGTFSFQVRVADEPQAANVAAVARLWGRNSEGGSQQWAETTAVFGLAAVTLNAPKTAKTGKFTVSGDAPPGKTVEVLDSGTLLGQTQSRAGGTWVLDVDLPLHEDVDLTKVSGHWLTAGYVAEDGTLVYSSPSDVLVGNAPFAGAEIKSVTLHQPGYQTVTFVPPEHVSIVYVPSEPLVTTVRFADPDAVKNVKVRYCAPAPFCTDYPTQKQKDGSYVTVAYHVRPEGMSIVYDLVPPDPPPPAMPENLADVGAIGRQALPPGIAVTNGHVSVDDNSLRASGSMGKLNFSTSISMSPIESWSGESNPFQGKVTPPDTPPHKPSVYGYKSSYQEGPQGATFSATFVVPASALPGVDLSTLTTEAAGASTPTLRAQGKVGDVVVQVAGVIDSSGTTGAISSLYGIYQSYGWYQQLLNDIDWAANHCDPDTSQMYTSIYNNIFTQYRQALAIQAVAGAASLLLEIGGVTAPIGLAFGALTAVFSLATSWSINSDLAHWESDMHNNKYCQDSDVDTVYDPSGYVYAAVYDNRVPGITATALEDDGPDTSTSDPNDRIWSPWDASAYNQVNPQTTDQNGHYGWDVPEGDWKVSFYGSGYAPAESNVVHVPPPQTQVNVGLMSTTPGAVSAASATTERVRVDFDHYMLASQLGSANMSVTDSVYHLAIPGTWAPVAVQSDVYGDDVARAVVFAPTVPLTAGDTVNLIVSGGVQTYAGIPMASDYNKTLTVQPADTTPPGEVSDAQAVAGDGGIGLMWTDPSGPGSADLAGVAVAWRVSGTGAYGPEETVPAGQGSYGIDGLTNGTAYDVRLRTVDEDDNESPGVVLHATPQGPDGTGPANVSSVRVTPEDGQLRLSWTDPSDPDFAGVKISWLSEGTSSGGSGGTSGSGLGSPLPLVLSPTLPGIVTVAKGTRSYTIPNVNNGTTYRILLVAVDTNHNSASGITAEGTPSATAGSHAGGTGGGVGVAGVSFPAADCAAPPTFPDIPAGNWAHDQVEDLACRGVIAGFPNGSFEPQGTVTRAQFATLMARLLQLPPAAGGADGNGAAAAFLDVPANAWYAPEVAAVVAAGLMNGTSATTFAPAAPISREQMAVVLARTLQWLADHGGAPMPPAPPANALQVYGDADQIDDWARHDVALVTAAGYMQGFLDGTFRPLDDTTRAQAAAVLEEVLARQSR